MKIIFITFGVSARFAYTRGIYEVSTFFRGSVFAKLLDWFYRKPVIHNLSISFHLTFIFIL